MAALRTVVVEDERLARRKLVMLLSTEPGVELVGECGTAEDAVNLLRAERPDLVFLDIQLPGMDGFEVLQHAGLENVGHVVVVTAHDRYALKAFDVAAIDYLLKPYDRTRLRQTLARVQGRGTSDLHGRLLALAERLGAGSERLHRLVIREGERIRFLDVGSVDWFESADNYVKVQVGVAEHLVRTTLQRLEQRLDPARFIPGLLSPATGSLRAVGVGWAGYDGAAHDPVMGALAQARLGSRVILGVSATYAPATATTPGAVRPSVSLHVQLLDQERHGLNAGLGFGFHQDRFVGEEGFLEAVATAGWRSDRTTVVANVPRRLVNVTKAVIQGQLRRDLERILRVEFPVARVRHNLSQRTGEVCRRRSPEQKIREGVSLRTRLPRPSLVPSPCASKRKRPERISQTCGQSRSALLDVILVTSFVTTKFKRVASDHLGEVIDEFDVVFGEGVALAVVVEHPRVTCRGYGWKAAIIADRQLREQ